MLDLDPELQQISNLIRHEDETNQELALLLLQGRADCPFWLILQLALHFLHANRPEFVDKFLSERYDEEQLATIWAASRFLHYTSWKTRWHSENVYSTNPANLRHFLHHFSNFWADYALLFAYQPDYLPDLVDAVSVAWWFYRCEEVEFLLQNTAELAPDEPDLLFYLSECRQNAQDWEAAEGYLLRFLQLQAGLVYDNLYPIDEDFTERFRYFPDSLQAWIGLMRIYTQTQRWNEAIAAAQKGLELAPQHHQAPRLALVALLTTADNPNMEYVMGLLRQQWECEECIQSKDADIYPHARWLYRSRQGQRKQLLEQIGQYSEQAGHWRSSLWAYKRCQNLEKQLQIVLKQTRDYWQAEVLIAKILKTDPNNSLALRWLPIVEDKIYRQKTPIF